MASSAENVSSCPICLVAFKAEELRYNVVKCSQCLVFYHTICSSRIKVLKGQTVARCPTCRHEFFGQQPSKLENMYIKYSLQLFKCHLCGCERGEEHTAWCLIERGFKKLNRQT